ncbi:MAG: hypothetical protein QOK04_2217 [Solirubrobacteraceae bacterium]|nr:hypothetical protein [Solirubrobacteraceae bacterium]
MRGAEPLHMASAPRTPPTLDDEIMRRALITFSAGACHCADCRRTPLVGERVHVYDDGRVYCELCRAHRREEPIRCERIRGDFSHAVRLTVRAA